jgi:hypothetical protein
MAPLAAEWLHNFVALHERARRGELEGRALESYGRGRSTLARILLAAQRVALPLGGDARGTLRVARAVHVDIESPRGDERAPTLDVSATGFGAWTASPLEPGDVVSVALSLPGGEELRARARVVRVQPNDGGPRRSVGFQFVGLAAGDAERLEMFVFDTVLERLT